MRQVLQAVILSLAALIGITANAGCSAMKNGSLASVAPVTQNDRVGSVYLLRGWIGVFSTGIDSLGAKVAEDGIHAEVYQEAQWSRLADEMIARYANHPDHEPIVLVGHSYGADDTIKILHKLAEHDIHVDLVITLDPVTPRKVPSNATLVYNLYQSSALDALPWLRGIPLTPAEPGPGELRNMNVRVDRTDLMDGKIDHFNIEKKETIHTDVLAQIHKVCLPRHEWIASRQPVTPENTIAVGLSINTHSAAYAHAAQASIRD